MLLLHAAKQLMGGLWKGVLRDWASPGGALLPLQCVMDLLGNVYNANSLAALEQQPALLGGGQQLLDAVQPVAVQEGECSRPGSAVVTAAAAAAVPLQPGSVSAALKEVLVDGPLGPASAVDFDNLLAMLMVQFDAGESMCSTPHCGVQRVCDMGGCLDGLGDGHFPVAAWANMQHPLHETHHTLLCCCKRNIDTLWNALTPSWP